MPRLFYLILAALIALPPAVLVSSHSTVGHVVISEIQVGGVVANDEFVELFNPTDCPVVMSDWKLVKKSTSLENIVTRLNGTVPAHGFFLIKHPSYAILAADVVYSSNSYSITSNNTVYLFADQEKTILVDKVGMGTAGDVEAAAASMPANGQSIERIDGNDTDNNSLDFQIQSAPLPQNSASPPTSSPGTCQVVVTPPPLPTSVAGATVVTIAQARHVPFGQTVMIEGTAIVAPGQLSANYFYIQDESSGIQIYSSKKTFPALTIGQKVRVQGELSEAYNEKRLKISAVNNVSLVGTGTLSTRRQRTGEIDEDDEGQLVAVSGPVSETSGDIFYLDDGSGAVKIYIRDETGIDKPRMAKGDRVAVVGIVSQYKNEYRVLPRAQSDLATGTTSTAAALDKAVDRPDTDATAVAGETAANLPVAAAVATTKNYRVPGLVSIGFGSLVLLLLPYLAWDKKRRWTAGQLLKLKHSLSSWRKS